MLIVDSIPIFHSSADICASSLSFYSLSHGNTLVKIKYIPSGELDSSNKRKMQFGLYRSHFESVDQRINLVRYIFSKEYFIKAVTAQNLRRKLSKH